MTFGVTFTNNQNTVILDSEFASLCIIASGRYAPTQESGLGSVTYFPRVVTSQEPPLVFCRPDTVAAIAGLCQMQLLGSAGNWVGFYVRAYSANTAQPNGQYFVASFGAQPVATFGIRMWNAVGKLIFDSGCPAALFTRSFSNWTYVKSEQTATTSYRNYYSVPFNFPANEFLLINSFGMNLLSGDNVGRTIATWWDFPSSTLWAITDCFSNPYDFHLPAVFAKMNA